MTSTITPPRVALWLEMALRFEETTGNIAPRDKTAFLKEWAPEFSAWWRQEHQAGRVRETMPRPDVAALVNEHWDEIRPGTD